VQGLVYIFIALAALGVAAAAYLGLTFTPIEAIVTAICFGAVATLLMERRLRHRSEARLERAIEDLARLLSTDAQAGQVLSQRINQLADSNAANRLDTIEADISVLGTVVRQVAEAVAELEESQPRGPAATPSVVRPASPAKETDEDALPEPVIPVEMLRQALAENRLVCHIAPIVQLPQRRTYGYDLVPRLMLEDAELAEPPDFMPRQGHEDLVRRVDAHLFEQSITIARRSRTAGQPIRLFVPISRHSLADPDSLARLLAALDANRAVSTSLVFAMTQAEFRLIAQSLKVGLEQVSRLGATFALAQATSLRFDFGELEGLGFESVCVDATRFLRGPDAFTDFHPADVAAYAQRFRMNVIATGLIDEQQLLMLFEQGIGYVSGPHIARPGPARHDLVADTSEEPALRRVEG
jgi:cyclic-di-GMP phosphodiesterase TipF (flagellum assembly factor)